MASADSAHYALQKPDRVNTSRQAPPGISSGQVHFAEIAVSFAGTESAADTVNLCQLPAGAIPIPALSNIVVNTDPGTTLTVDVGSAADPDGWCDGANVAAVGKVEFLTPAIPAWQSTRAELAADSGAEDGLTTIYATWATVGTNVAATFTFVLAYKLDR